MYADTVTRSMRAAIDETERRRRIQSAYNEANGITPQTVRKRVHDVIEIGRKATAEETRMPSAKKKLSASEREKLIASMTADMKKAAARLDFERAAYLRDRIRELREAK